LQTADMTFKVIQGHRKPRDSMALFSKQS